MAQKITLAEYLDLRTPAWHKGVWGQRWINALGGKVNDLVTWGKDGVKSSFPDIAPSAALKYIAKDRGIERAPGESDADFRLRLWGAWETWKWSGTTLGVYRGFETCGFTISPWVTVPWFSWPADWPEDGHVWIFPYNSVRGSAPDDDNDNTHWARFWVALDGYAEGITETPYTVGGGLVVTTSGAAIGISSTADEVARWKRVIRKWKGSHSTCPAIYIVLSDGGWGDIIGPFGTLIGDGAVIGAVVGKIPVGES